MPLNSITNHNPAVNQPDKPGYQPTELEQNLANLHRLVSWTIENLPSIQHDAEAIESALFDIAEAAIESIPITFQPDTLEERYAATGALAMTILQSQYDLPMADIIAAGDVLAAERELTARIWK